jgi:hypothetical protein
MSDSLRLEPYNRLMLGDTELRIGERIEVLVDGQWRAGFVRFERNWQSFYIKLHGRTIWQWKGVPARRALQKPEAP